jgi:hypothetical protein
LELEKSGEEAQCKWSAAGLLSVPCPESSSAPENLFNRIGIACYEDGMFSSISIVLICKRLILILTYCHIDIELIFIFKNHILEVVCAIALKGVSVIQILSILFTLSKLWNSINTKSV